MKKEKVHILTDSDLRKKEKKQFKDISRFSIYMVLAWLKDTGYIDNDPNVLVAEYKRMESWFAAWKDHLISIEDIKNIIERDTGMEARISDE